MAVDTPLHQPTKQIGLKTRLWWTVSGNDPAIQFGESIIVISTSWWQDMEAAGIRSEDRNCSIYIYKVVYITCKSFFNKLCSIIALCKPKQKKQVQLGLSEKYWNTSKIPSSLVFFIVLMAINPHFVRPNPRRQQPSCRTYGIRTYGRASMTTLPEASW